MAKVFNRAVKVGGASVVEGDNERQVLIYDGDNNPIIYKGAKAGSIELPLLEQGSSTIPIEHTAETEKVYEMHVTNSSQNGSTSYEPVLFSTEMTGAGQVGGRVRFYMKTDVVLGGWANALKAEIDFETDGGVTGLGSALVAEMTLPGSTISTGNYAPLEIELNAPASFVSAGAGTPVGFMYLSTQGATVGEIDDHGYLAIIKGLTAGSGHLLQTGGTLANAAATLKVLVGGTEYYIPLYDGQITA